MGEFSIGLASDYIENLGHALQQSQSTKVVFDSRLLDRPLYATEKSLFASALVKQNWSKAIRIAVLTKEAWLYQYRPFEDVTIQNGLSVRTFSVIPELAAWLSIDEHSIARSESGSIRFFFDLGANYVDIVIEGNPDLSDYLEAARELGRSGDLKASTHRICDFSGVDNLKVSTAHLLALIAEVRSLPMTDQTRVALVSKDQGGIMKLFSSHFSVGKFRTFGNTRDAVTWVTQGPDVGEGDVISQENIHLIRLKGTVTAGELLVSQQAWYDDRLFDPDVSVLWDIRDASLKLDFQELNAVVDRMLIYLDATRPQGKVGVLLNSRLNEIMVNSVLSDSGLGERLLVTRNQEAARSFLAST